MKERSPKYLIIGEAFYPEEFLINDLVKEWEKRGYHLEVITRTPSYPFGKVYKGYKNRIYQKELWGNIVIHRFPVIQGYQRNKFLKIFNYFSFVIFGTVIALLIGRRYSKVFIFHTGPLSLAIPGIIIKKIYNKPVTIWSFDLWPATIYAYGFKKTKLLTWFLDNLVEWVYSNCENIFVSSRGFIPEVQKYSDGKTIHFAPNWPQTIQVKDKKSSVVLPDRIFHFTFTGNVGKVQNLENVILGFHRASLDNTHLNIIGEGSRLKNLEDFVSKNNFKNIIFHGKINLDEINDVLEHSDVLIVSLIPDPVMELTVPLKFQTYLLASKPIFAIMEGEVKSIVIDYHIGKVAHPLNIDEIANGFKDFFIKPIDIAEVKLQTDNLVKSVFNREKVISELTSIFFS